MSLLPWYYSKDAYPLNQRHFTHPLYIYLPYLKISILYVLSLVVRNRLKESSFADTKVDDTKNFKKRDGGTKGKISHYYLNKNIKHV